MLQRIGVRRIVVLVVGVLLFWQAVVLRRGLLQEDRPHADPCVSNLRMIGYGSHLYAVEHGGCFPDDLAQLAGVGLREFSWNPQCLVCPHLARDVWDMSYSDLRRAELSDEYRSYCYVSGLTSADPPHYVLAFDEELNHCGKGIEVLCVSAHVEWTTDIAGLQTRLKKQEAEMARDGRKMDVRRPSWSRYPEPPEYPPSPKSPYERLGGTKGVVPVVVGGLILAAAVG